MIYTAVAAGPDRLHSVMCRAGGICFDGGPWLPWPTLGRDVRLAAAAVHLVAVAKGQDGPYGGRLIVGNETGRLIDIGVVHGEQAVAVEAVSGDLVRVAAVTGPLTWQTWIVSGDLSSVTLESSNAVPDSIPGTSQGWTQFVNGVPSWTDLARFVVLGSVRFEQPSRAGRWTVGLSNRDYGVDAYDHESGLVCRVWDGQTPIPPGVASLPDGSALVAISADVPAFIASRDFRANWTPTVSFAQTDQKIGVGLFDDLWAVGWMPNDNALAIVCTVDKDTPQRIAESAAVAKAQRKPWMCYWDKPTIYAPDDVPVVPGVETIPLVQCYRVAGESLTNAAARWWATIATLKTQYPKVALCLQGYLGSRGVTNTFTPDEVLAGQVAAWDLAIEFQCCAVVVFAWDRADGMKNSPALQDVYQRLKAASGDANHFPTVTKPVPVQPAEQDDEDMPEPLDGAGKEKAAKDLGPIVALYHQIPVSEGEQGIREAIDALPTGSPADWMTLAGARAHGATTTQRETAAAFIQERLPRRR